MAKGPPGPKPEISPNHGRTQASEGRLPRLCGFQATLGKKEPPRLPPTPPHSLPRPRPPPGPCSQETHTPWPDGSHARSTSEAAPRLPSPGQTARDCNLGTDRAQSTSEAAPRPPHPGRRTLTRECCSKPPSFGMTCCRATDNLDYRMDRDTWGPKPRTWTGTRARPDEGRERSRLGPAGVRGWEPRLSGEHGESHESDKTGGAAAAHRGARPEGGSDASRGPGRPGFRGTQPSPGPARAQIGFSREGPQELRGGLSPPGHNTSGPVRTLAPGWAWQAQERHPQALLWTWSPDWPELTKTSVSAASSGVQSSPRPAVSWGANAPLLGPQLPPWTQHGPA